MEHHELPVADAATVWDICVKWRERSVPLPTNVVLFSYSLLFQVLHNGVVFTHTPCLKVSVRSIQTLGQYHTHILLYMYIALHTLTRLSTQQAQLRLLTEVVTRDQRHPYSRRPRPCQIACVIYNFILVP